MTTSTTIHIPGTRIGEPTRAGGVSVFPIFGPPSGGTAVGLADDRLEVSELASATVPALEVYNPSDVDMLIPAGRILEGGRQTRVVNVTIVVPKGARLPIPVSCIEQGRWHGHRRFHDRKRVVSRRMRAIKQMAVRESIEHGAGRADHLASKMADQGLIWDVVRRELDSRGIDNATSRYTEADDFVQHDPRSREVLDRLAATGPQVGQTGIAVAVGAHVIGMEIFPSDVTLREAWDGLVRQAVLELPADRVEAEADVADVERFLARVANAPATEAPGVGVGRELHASTEEFTAHALEVDGALIYANAFVSA